MFWEHNQKIQFHGVDDYPKEGFILALICWVWIGIYDTCFLDFVVFANWKKLRLPGTETMDKAYHQKKFHVVSALKFGTPIALLISLLTGLLVMLFA